MTKALALVAHPDDETIWMGGTLLTKNHWEWTIASLCRKNDKDRAPKFLRVCKEYNARPIISDLDDEKLQDLSTIEVVKKIKEVLPENKFDYIYTHGKNGEYGHKRHKEIHKAVKQMLKDKELICNKIYYFSYKQGNLKVPNNPDLCVAIPSARARERAKLTKDNFKKKRMLIIDEYGFGGDSFEAMSCNVTEAFDTK